MNNIEYFFSICSLADHFLNSIRWARVLNFDEIQYVNLTKNWLILDISFLRNLFLLQDCKWHPLCFQLEFLHFNFIIMVIIYFQRMLFFIIQGKVWNSFSLGEASVQLGSFIIYWKYLSPHWIACHLCQRSVNHTGVALFWILLCYVCLSLDN